MMDYIDSHAHLTLVDQNDVSGIVERSRAQGVRRLITVSTDETNWKENELHALKSSDIFFSLGLHPHAAYRYRALAPQLDSFFENGVPTRCVGIGETGLDFHYDKSPHDQQVESFEAHLKLASRINLPIIIHSRDAFDETYSAIRKVGLPRAGGVMHCFTGGVSDARAALDLGLHLSFSGILTFKNAEAIREAARDAPLNRILLETDCPFLSPEPYRGKPNEPSRLPIIAQRLGAVRGLTIEEVAYSTCQNTVELFRI